MSPRTGRPKIDNPKSFDIKVRVDAAMNENLIKYAEKHGISRTEVIRAAINSFLAKEK